VPVPDFQSVMLPFLETLQDGNVRTMRELTELLSVRFNLTDDERQALPARVHSQKGVILTVNPDTVGCV